MARPAYLVRWSPKSHGSRGVGSGGFPNLTGRVESGRVGSGQEVFNVASRDALP